MAVLDPKRAVIQIELDARDKRALEDLASLRGMTQISVMSRMIRWLSNQDEDVQSTILRDLPPEELRKVALEALRRLAIDKP